MRCRLHQWRAVVLLAAGLMLGSCASTEKNAWLELRAEHMATKPMVQIAGTVFRTDLEGGLHLIRNHVQLLDVPRQEAPATIVAGASVPTHERQVPIPFKLAFNPGKVLEKHTYAVRAVIRSEGAVVFTISTRYPVITRGNPSHADLMLVRVSGMKSYTARVSGTTWVLEDLAGGGVVDRVQATLVFSEDGSVRGNASCNQFRSSVTASADSFKLNPLATTRKICAEAVMLQETRYLAALREPERFEVKGEFLHIHVAGQSQPLRFIGARDKQGDR